MKNEKENKNKPSSTFMVLILSGKKKRNSDDPIKYCMALNKLTYLDSRL